MPLWTELIVFISPSDWAGVDLTVVPPAGPHSTAALLLGGVSGQHIIAEIGIVQVVIALLPLSTRASHHGCVHYAPISHQRPAPALAALWVEFLIVTGADTQEGALHVLTESRPAHRCDHLTLIDVNTSWSPRRVFKATVTEARVRAIRVLTETVAATDGLINALINVTLSIRSSVEPRLAALEAVV